MTLFQFVIDIPFVFGLMGLGAWLEGINGTHGLADKYFTPLPMGMSGLAMAWCMA